MFPLLFHLELVQQTLQQQQIDGWLLYDFRASNPPMRALLGLDAPLTRRLLYWVPASGSPLLVRHAIEHAALCKLEELHHSQGEVAVFSSWRELEQLLQQLLHGSRRVAMEISSDLPYLSCVDAGTAEWIKAMGVELVSSSSVLQQLLARWDQPALESHLQAARALEEEVLQAMRWLHQELRQREPSELEMALRLQRALQARGMCVEHLPIVAVAAHSADPHHLPSSTTSIGLGQVLLVDVWCKQQSSGSRYADICRMAFTGSQVNSKQRQAFDLVLGAQRAALELLRARCNQPLAGYELDRVARSFIASAGFASFFTHRLGHSIDLEDHGSGTHLDDWESHDIRQVMTRSCFSIEPGLYFPGEFGVRLESDLYLDARGNPHLTGGFQQEWYYLDPEADLYLPQPTSPLTLEL